MSKRQIFYAIVGYMGIGWAAAINASGQPFDAFALATVSLIVLHESYREEPKS